MNYRVMMKFIKIFFAGVIVLMFSCNTPSIAEEVQHQVEQANIGEKDGGGDIWAYRESYVPIKYSPTPEYMVFVDMAILIMIMLTGLFFVLRRKYSRVFSMLTIITLVYLGLIRGGCICPVGVISNVTMGLMNPTNVGLVTTVIFLVPLIIALIAGRVFCTTGCPLGAVQHLFYKRKKHIKLPDRLNSVLKVLPAIMLVGTIYAAIKAQCFLVCELEPYKVAFFTGKTWFEQILAFLMGHSMEARFLWTFGIFTWLYLAVMLVIGYWIPRPFCRFICPYGVLLGIFSLFSFKPRKIDNEKCIHCGMCQKICPTQAIVIDRKSSTSSLSNYSCVQCNLCSKSCKVDAVK